METTGAARQVPVAIATDLTVGDLRSALMAGWRDFLARPLFGLFFGGIFTLTGMFLYVALFAWGQPSWLVPVTAGFPLLAPFTAVGLYEVSRRREAGLPVGWSPVLGALRGHGDEQLLTMGGLLFVGFSFWLMVAHGIFAIFMAESGVGAESMALFGTQTGIAMLAVGGAAGGLMALAFYSLTVISLPMLVDRPIDFMTAMITSLRVMKANLPVMLAWAALVAVTLSLALLPLFLGLLVALPVLGHATWHLYRRAVAA